LILRITLKLELRDEALLSTLRKSLAPDDRDLPKGINLSSYANGAELIYTVEASINKRHDILTLCNVVDDILRHSKLVLKVLNDIS